MKVAGRHYRTIWPAEDGQSVHVVDQTKLPHAFEIATLDTIDAVASAIRTMVVRGAPLIGAAAAYGVALALRHDASDQGLDVASETLRATRPTAVNLAWALDRMSGLVRPLPEAERASSAWREAAAICDEDVETCRCIGVNGLPLLREAATRSPGRPVNVLTHCNAGWLATVDWGTALAPVYLAHSAGIPIHVWVDETRPRNQGAALTAFELAAHGVPFTVVADNAGGRLMQTGRVDLCIVGADRVSSNGDVANKIGTYLKALAAHDTGVPFYVAAPSSSVDWRLMSGETIPIEDRAEAEVTRVTGRLPDGTIASVEIVPKGSRAANPAFDVTPARLISAFITERGLCAATADALAGVFPPASRAGAAS